MPFADIIWSIPKQSCVLLLTAALFPHPPPYPSRSPTFESMTVAKVPRLLYLFVSYFNQLEKSRLLPPTPEANDAYAYIATLAVVAACRRVAEFVKLPILDIVVVLGTTIASNLRPALSQPKGIKGHSPQSENLRQWDSTAQYGETIRARRAVIYKEPIFKNNWVPYRICYPTAPLPPRRSQVGRSRLESRAERRANTRAPPAGYLGGRGGYRMMAKNQESSYETSGDGNGDSSQKNTLLTRLNGSRRVNHERSTIGQPLSRELGVNFIITKLEPKKDSPFGRRLVGADDDKKKTTLLRVRSSRIFYRTRLPRALCTRLGPRALARCGSAAVADGLTRYPGCGACGIFGLKSLLVTLKVVMLQVECTVECTAAPPPEGVRFASRP
ncbi:hypothetical protein EVAR_18116_1 [Eumeta japonica]|uniref:Uncharacterized protein n=1 Tax=Eumeta variegata TaxID=151549 RepID=A0A4C1VH23_EUMVA|nr:hypothetical protein EVAR_18116_1 [Eumeta japonica]